MGDAPKDGDDSEQDEAKPTKVVFEELTLQVRARCMQLDYEGRSNGRSMHTILTHIAPRHLVLCHGSTQVQILLASLSCHAVCMHERPVLPCVTLLLGHASTRWLLKCSRIRTCCVSCHVLLMGVSAVSGIYRRLLRPFMNVLALCRL